MAADVGYISRVSFLRWRAPAQNVPSSMPNRCEHVRERVPAVHDVVAVVLIIACMGAIARLEWDSPTVLHARRTRRTYTHDNRIAREPVVLPSWSSSSPWSLSSPWLPSLLCSLCNSLRVFRRVVSRELNATPLSRRRFRWCAASRFSRRLARAFLSLSKWLTCTASAVATDPVAIVRRRYVV